MAETEGIPNSEEPIVLEGAAEQQIPSTASLSIFTSRPETIISKDDVNFSDPLFPYSPEFASRTRKEKEQLFLRKYEEQLLIIRNKELKCGPTPVESLLSQDRIEEIIGARNQFYERYQNNESRKAITRTETEVSQLQPPRIDTITTPTFDPLLNIHFESQFNLLDTFKHALSQTMIRNRAEKRIRMLAQSLLSENSNAVENIQTTIKETLSPQSLLTPPVRCIDRLLPKFSRPELFAVPPPPEVSILPHHIEKSFPLYTPGPVERFQLTPFSRTDITTFVFLPVEPPERFPTVSEEQPIRERSLDQLTKVEIHDIPTEEPFNLPKIIQYPRETRYFPFDPAYPLRPQPISLPDLPNEIGRACILALPMAEYGRMSIAGKGKFAFAPQEFTGVPKFGESKLRPMTEPDPIDLKELEADDDIDNINIKPKVRPITDFMTKAVSTKNKSNQILEIITEGQTQWRERQRAGGKKQIEVIEGTNQIMNDTAMKLPLSDLHEFMKQ